MKTLAAAAAGFTILPAATTYDRVWRVQRQLHVPAWNPVDYLGEVRWINIQDGTTRLFSRETWDMKIISDSLRSSWRA